MASLIPGYKYDIFISYRQKDNKYDGWVTEFVDNLKKELEAGFKEEISVYFDINPHDGLLETHDVDTSLKEKLNCLVFIPIISRTYCDPKSFAWEHEFKAFVEKAANDQFGLKVKLPKGNVAGRVLPIRIYELDSDDIKLCETVLGGVLRGVDFIYAEPGVNRPLKSDDDEKINLNKTKYRNQINKVGNAIKELISGMKAEPVEPCKEKIRQREPSAIVKKDEKIGFEEKPDKAGKRKILSFVALVAIVIIASIFAYPKIFKKDKLDYLRSSDGRISVAVMPFQNMTNDTTWNIWQDVIQDNLITFLSNFSEELQVRQSESIKSMLQNKDLTDYASITPSLASAISQKLDADIFINGSINKADNTIRINAQLINSKTEEIFKSFQIEGLAEEEHIFQFIDSLSVEIKNFLVISRLEKQESADIKYFTSTKSPEAFSFFVQGRNDFTKNDYPSAVSMFTRAVAIDSNFTFASVMLSFSYILQGMYEPAKMWCLRAYEKRDQMPLLLKNYTNILYAFNFETPNERIKYLRQMQEIDNQIPIIYYHLGNSYNVMLQYAKAIPEFEKALEIYDKWETKPFWILNYTPLGKAYHETGKYKEEKRLYKKAEQDFPDHPYLIYRQAVLSLTLGDIVSANSYIDKYISVRKENSIPEANILTYVAGIYSEAGILDKAEEFYRKAVLLEPENHVRMNNLAWFLIDNDLNINEGLELVDKAIKLNPDNYLYLDTKGWGLYKKGIYKEALEIIEKSWTLKPIYNHGIYLHLEEAKKAVSNQK
jgi:tetratricopeptide (TPR) repeat protein